MRYKPRGWLLFQSSTAASSSIHDDSRLKRVSKLPLNSEYCWLHQYLFFLFCYSKGKVLLVFYKFSFSFFSHPCFTVVEHHSNLSWTILGKYGKFSIFLTSLSFIIILCKAYTTIFNNILSWSSSISWPVIPLRKFRFSYSTMVATCLWVSPFFRDQVSAVTKFP